MSTATHPLSLGEGQATPTPWHHTALTLSAPAPFHPTLEPDVLGPSLSHVCAQAHLEVAGRLLHRFEPQGLSLLLFGPSLRLALHTWPERGVATLDVLCTEGGTERLVEAVCIALGLRVTERHQHPRMEGSRP